jgi:hypothetical protein
MDANSLYPSEAMIATELYGFNGENCPRGGLLNNAIPGTNSLVRF